MAFSGSYNYTESYTAANIIELSLEHLGIKDMSESVNSTEETRALVQLNLVLKELSGQGADVWVRKTGHLFLFEPGISTSYTVGTSGTAKFTQQYYTTTLSAAASSTDTTITVTDDTNMLDTDIILVEQDDGSLHDTTISGAPSSNSVTLAAGLADDAASGNIVYSWPTTDSLSDKIVKLVHCARRQTNTDNAATNAGYMEGIDTPIEIIGEEEYRLLSQKWQTGVPTHIHHRADTLNPELSVWPTGGSSPYHSIVIEYNTYLQDLDATSNNLDLPPEGVNALSYRLAAELSAAYGLPLQDRTYLWTLANAKIRDFLDFAVEDSSLVLALGNRR